MMMNEKVDHEVRCGRTYLTPRSEPRDSARARSCSMRDTRRCTRCRVWTESQPCSSAGACAWSFSSFSTARVAWRHPMRTNVKSLGQSAGESPGGALPRVSAPTAAAVVLRYWSRISEKMTCIFVGMQFGQIANKHENCQL